MDKGVGNRIKKLLEQYNMTQRQFAEKVGVQETAISHYIKGDRRPRGAILLNIANVLHTTTDYLLSGKDNENNPNEDIELSYRILARNAKSMTLEEKQRFFKLLVEGD